MKAEREAAMQMRVLVPIEVVLLVAGALAARAFVRRVGRGERKVVVMTSVATWLVLFGMVPFLAFAAFTPAARSTEGAGGGARQPGSGSPAGPVETFVLNLVPLALVASPVAGGVQALWVTSARRGTHSG